MDVEGARPKGIALSDRQRIAWLRLIRSDNVGPATFRGLINHFGSAEAALAALPELSARGGATRAIRIATEAEAHRELETARRFGARFIGIGEPDYPQALRQIDGAPPLIAVKGDVSVLHRPATGIVGSRNASISGAKFAAMIARDCGRAGYAVVSGLARGIDTAAHRASLDTGTIAALAGGLDQPYPPENVSLLDEICSGNGLAISEMPFGWEPRARDFPRRNRLIAGIALGLVVVEAATRSGSLITARLAGEFGRPGLCRTRLAARSALPGHQRPVERRGDDRHFARRRHRGTGAALAARPIFGTNGGGAGQQRPRPIAARRFRAGADHRCARSGTGRG